MSHGTRLGPLATVDGSEELIVDVRAGAPVTAMRSTVLVALRGAFREAGLFEAYEAKLDPRVAGELTHMVAATWVPLDLVNAHYAASDALALPTRDQIALGGAAAERILTALLGTALRIAASAGTTPWGFIAQIGRFWGRGYAGGGIRVIKHGPKEAYVVILDNSIHHLSPFARHSFVGVASVVFKPFCMRFLMRVDAVAEKPDDTVRYLAQWV